MRRPHRPSCRFFTVLRRFESVVDPGTANRTIGGNRTTSGCLALRRVRVPGLSAPAPASRRRGVVAACVAVLVLGVFLLGALLVRSDRSTRSSVPSREAAVEVPSMQSPDADVEVFMNVGAAPAQLDGARSWLEHNPAVRKYAFVSNAQAFDEFKRLFADQPGLVATVSPSELPTSFRVQVAPDANRDAMTTELQRLEGVDDVKALARDGDGVPVCRKLASALDRPPNEICG